jgi:hypothetical protein
MPLRPTTRPPTGSTPVHLVDPGRPRCLGGARHLPRPFEGRGPRVFGHVDGSDRLDLGTQTAFVQGSADSVSGDAPTAALPTAADRTWQRSILPGAVVDRGATIDGGSSIGSGSRVEPGALVRGSVLMDDARIESGARVERSVVGRGAAIGGGTVAIDAAEKRTPPSPISVHRPVPDAVSQFASGTDRGAVADGRRERLNRHGPPRRR